MPSQEWLNDNRERFDAVWDSVDVQAKPCAHYFIRVRSGVIGCKHCTAQWLDQNQMDIKDGELEI